MLAYPNAEEESLRRNVRLLVETEGLDHFQQSTHVSGQQVQPLYLERVVANSQSCEPVLLPEELRERPAN